MLCVKEHERRYKAYLETKTDQQAADKLGISIRAFTCWRQNIGIRKHDVKKDNSYVLKRPLWERRRMRHFGNFLERLPAVPADISSVIELYIDEFGENTNGR